MRNVEYITNGFGGWTDLIQSQLQSPEFKDLIRQNALRTFDPGYFSSPSGPEGVSVRPTGPTPRTPAEAFQRKLTTAGYPASVSNAVFSIVNRFGVAGLDNPINFLMAYLEGLRAWGNSATGRKTVMLAGPSPEGPYALPKKVYIAAAKSAFNVAASRFGLGPISRVVRDFTLSQLESAPGDRNAANAVFYIPGGVFDILKGGPSIG